MSLTPGFYEALLTELLSERLNNLDAANEAAVSDLRNAEAADRIAWHIASIVERAIENFQEAKRAAVGVQLARSLIKHIAARAATKTLLEETPIRPGKVLRGIHGLNPDGTPAVVEGPLIPLLDTALLTNSPGEPRVGHQIVAEIGSADRIDVVMAFIRRSGIAPMREQLRRHVEAGKQLRILTTAYTGSTEPLALDWLAELGAQVRVSYDTSPTRLHAKSWLFHRESGFSTAYVGSSNLTHSAQIPGLEWNVRVSGARNRPVIEKIAAVFDSYWELPEFEPYDAERFAKEIGRDRTAGTRILLSPTEIRLEPFQERLLEQIDLARQQGRHRNLLVSATGTGKTVMAAMDYARLRKRLPRARLLFIAHREEILDQSRATFAQAVRDANFGEMWVGGRRPAEFQHVFASIQSLNAAGLATLDPKHFDVVIVDEFHHAAAATYDRILKALNPVELLGLTATPERSDSEPVLHWFDDRIAAELRLWDAIDQHRLVPFAYYGISDNLDLREVPWRRGTGYDVNRLTNVITSTDVWARYVLNQFATRIGNDSGARVLGFCVSVDHARYMARIFDDHGVRSVAVSADAPEGERKNALRDLAAGRITVVFSVDLFNEGVDVPEVDVLLMLRPTESPLLFIQQLGRGLRRNKDKTVCTVLDFVAHHRKEFRYDRRFRALLGGSRRHVEKQVESGFPFLPAGCHMELDRVATERVLQSIRNSVPRTQAERAAELARLAVEQPNISLSQFLAESTLDLEDIYSNSRSWSDLRARAGLSLAPAGPHDKIMLRACSRLLHVDDAERLRRWSDWLRNDASPTVDTLPGHEQRLLCMLLTQLLSRVPGGSRSLAEGADLLWAHPQVRYELLALIEVLEARMSHVTLPLEAPSDVPLRVHARYTRLEILAACGIGAGTQVIPWREGVYYAGDIPADLFAFTLDKTKGEFSPTTRYRDYAISRDLIHWESQSMTPADSQTGQRYQHHEARGSHVLLFARLDTDERAFHFLGPATYVSHVGERPMAVTWRLHHRLPGDLFQAFAAAVA